MSALYWPDLDCTAESRTIAHVSVVHEHHATERAACEAFIRYAHTRLAQAEAGDRYRCIRGPRGLLRGVEHNGMRLRDVDRHGNEIWVPLHETTVLVDRE